MATGDDNETPTPSLWASRTAQSDAAGRRPGMLAASPLGMAAFAAGYFGSAAASLGLVPSALQSPALWLPAGIYLGALLLVRTSHWPRLVAVALVMDALAGILFYERSAPVAVIIAMSNGVAAVTGAWLLHAVQADTFRLRTPGAALSLAVLGGLAGPGVGTALVALTLPRDAFAAGWLSWSLALGSGVLTLTPLMLAAASAPRSGRRISAGRWLEVAVLLVALAGLAHVAFTAGLPGVFMIAPLLLWAGLRGEVLITSIFTLVVAVITLRYAAAGFTAFAIPAFSEPARGMIVSLFIDVFSIVALMLSAAVAQQRFLTAALQRSRESLQEKIAARTDALHEVQSLFAAAFRLNPIPMGLLSWPEGRHVEVSDAWTASFGYSRAEALGMDSVQLNLYADVGERQRLFEALAREGRVRDREMRLRSKNGLFRDFVINAEVIELAGRQHLLTLASDVTQAKEAEAALLDSARRARRLIEANIVGVFTADREGMVEANDVFLRMIGRSREELEAGTLLWRTIPAPSGAAARWRALRQLRRHGRCEAYEQEFERPDGTRVPVLIGAAVTANPPLTWVSFAADLTLQKRVEELLRQADRRKDQFLATLAHELRNPLAPLRNAAQLLQSAESQSPQLARLSGMIVRQVSHLGRLVDDLLDVSRFTQGKIVLHTARQDLHAILGAASESIAPLMTSRRQKLHLHAPGHPVFVDGDEVRLVQVFANLLDNASKFSEDEGSIDVTLGAGEREAIVAVRDQGIGIPASLLPHVFDIFTQADGSLDRPKGGLGIGLSLVKALVVMHGGTVQARSDGAVRGSEFVVRLPLAAGPRQDNSSDRTALAPAPRKLRVLIVDDNRDAADTLAELLAMEGFDTRRAYEGNQALESAALFEPDAGLLDIGLPEMDGYELARTLRAQRPDALLIAITGYGGEPVRRRTREAGFQHHLVKPVSVQMVAELLAAHAATMRQKD
jgi:PAS domain S-box-containing protein